jgi:hypothetical protein
MKRFRKAAANARGAAGNKNRVPDQFQVRSPVID